MVTVSPVVPDISPVIDTTVGAASANTNLLVKAKSMNIEMDIVMMIDSVLLVFILGTPFVI